MAYDRDLVERRRVAGVVSLALMAVGGLTAHALAYRLVDSETGGAHGAAHEQEVHGYLAYWPLCVAVSGAALIVSLAAIAFTRARSHARLAPPLWLFALVPPLGFAVQEHLERLIASGVFPYAVTLEATFVVGLILQLPFALAAYLAARALIALAVAVARRRRGGERRRRRTSTPRFPRPLSPAVASAPALALGYGERGPPALAL